MILQVERDGKTFYMHAAWASDGEGTDFSVTEFEDAEYMGNYIDTNSLESLNYEDYIWTSVDGDAEEEADGEAIDVDVPDVYDELSKRIESVEASVSQMTNDLEATQEIIDDSIGSRKPNLLENINQGINGYLVSEGFAISSILDSVDDEAGSVNAAYLRVTCISPGAGYLLYDAVLLRSILGDSVENNTYCLSLWSRMSELFTINTIAVQNVNGTGRQIAFDSLNNEPIGFDSDTDVRNEWVYYESAEAAIGIEEDAQYFYFDLSNMAAGQTLDIANLKIEQGEIATGFSPAEEALSEVGRIKADYIKASELEADIARLGFLTAESAVIGSLQAANISIAERVTAAEGEIGILSSEKITVSDLTAQNLKTNVIAAITASVETINGNKITAGTLSADAINTSFLQTLNLDTNSLNARYANVTLANIDTANIDAAKIKDLFLGIGFIKDAVIDEGRITGFLDAVQVNASDIIAGTLTADRIELKGANGLYYAINADILPEGVTISSTTLNGQVIEDKTITADKIVTHCITANEITTGNLAGAGGWINLSSATFNFGNQLTWDGSKLNLRANSISILTGETYVDMSNISDYVNTVRTKIVADSEGLHIADSQTTFNTLMDSTSLKFRSGNNVMAEVTNRYLKINEGYMLKMQVGNFMLKGEIDGTFNIAYVGG